LILAESPRPNNCTTLDSASDTGWHKKKRWHCSSSSSSSSESSNSCTSKRFKEDRPFIGLCTIVPGFENFSEKDKHKIHAHLREGAAAGLFPKHAGTRWKWSHDDPCLDAVRTHLNKSPLVARRFAAVDASPGKRTAMVVGVSRSVIDAVGEPLLLDLIPKISKSKYSIRRLVSGSYWRLDLKKFAFVAEVNATPASGSATQRPALGSVGLFKHHPRTDELRHRLGEKRGAATCDVCGTSLSTWVRVRCYHRPPDGVFIPGMSLLPELFLVGRECLWKLLGVRQCPEGVAEALSSRLDQIAEDFFREVGGSS